MRKVYAIIQPLILSLVLIIGFIAATSENAGSTLQVFFFKPFYSWWYFGNMLNKMSLLLFAGSGALFALKTKNFNLGGEGQIYLAGFVTALLLQNRASIPSGLQFIGVLLAAMAAPAIVGLVSALLKNFFNTSELVTSFLLSAILIALINAAVIGPARDVSANLLATPPINPAFTISPFIPPAMLNISFVAALFFPIMGFLFFSHTVWGYRLYTAGIAPEFARASGFSVAAAPLVGMTISGALHGLTGFFAITGTWYVCHTEFSAGLGWAALAVALIARGNFIGLLPAALLYTWIETASEAVVMSGDVTLNISIFFQAAVFLLISAQRFNWRALWKHS